ncbi:MAG: ATP-binding protein [Evtepia gabavorous]|jgi:DNA replication protein DnaC|nr:MAG TPA: replicative helicase [Caudoviricetes sp.]
MTVEENGALRFQRCKCQSIRDAMGAMDRSGIPPDALAACTWENWKTPENWQRRALAMAQDYVQQIAAGDPSWFIICGTPGCGKTTLCTTIFRAIVEGGKPGLYVSWREFARRAKAVGNDRDDFREETEPLKNTPLLYLDDFWKGEIRPADVHLAFELINARYISKKPTILSSENTLEAILRGDEAIGSRLFEMAGGYYMDCSRARNWRTARRQA